MPAHHSARLVWSTPDPSNALTGPRPGCACMHNCACDPGFRQGRRVRTGRCRRRDRRNQSRGEYRSDRYARDPQKPQHCGYDREYGQGAGELFLERGHSCTFCVTHVPQKAECSPNVDTYGRIAPKRHLDRIKTYDEENCECSDGHARQDPNIARWSNHYLRSPHNTYTTDKLAMNTSPLAHYGVG